LNTRESSALRLDLTDVVVLDPRLYRSVVNGAVMVQGPLRAPRISGDLNLGETLITVPSAGGGPLSNLPPIDHVGADAQTRATQARAGFGPSGADQNAAGPGAALDVLVRAPARVFVRGRGLDAEMGGEIRLTGSANDIVSAGQFDLIRGRFDFLGNRFDLIEGAASFRGALLPDIRFVTRTDTDSGEARIRLDGPANAPQISLESSPPLPEDEIVSQILFGRSLSQISPLQALQLASALAEVSGRGGGGVVARLRDSFGLDDLDVTATEAGATQLRIGKYISDNIYSDVAADSGGKAEVSINLDLGAAVTVKGRVASDGRTGVGVFFERDY
jgi:translocation and assembly module TamB